MGKNFNPTFIISFLIIALIVFLILDYLKFRYLKKKLKSKLPYYRYFIDYFFGIPAITNDFKAENQRSFKEHIKNFHLDFFIVLVTLLLVPIALVISYLTTQLFISPF